MSADKYDINQPILILVRRGRGGRGYLVSPVDSPTDVAACASTGEVGEVVLELLDDENQPRINVEDLLRASESGDDGDEEDDDDDATFSNPPAASRAAAEDDDDDDDDDEDEDDTEEAEDGDEDKPWYDVRGAHDPADQILINVLHGVMGKAQKMSKTKGRRRRRRRGTGKPTKKAR